MKSKRSDNKLKLSRESQYIIEDLLDVELEAKRDKKKKVIDLVSMADTPKRNTHGSVSRVKGQSYIVNNKIILLHNGHLKDVEGIVLVDKHSKPYYVKFKKKEIVA